jgi:hypothetical protein
MATDRSTKQIVICPRIHIPLQPPADVPQEAPAPVQAEISSAWVQDGADFRLDICLPAAGTLEITFPTPFESLHVNGETVWTRSGMQASGMPGVEVERWPNGLRLTCTSGGAFHILAAGVSATDERR